MERSRFILSPLVIGPADVNRLLLEMEGLEDFVRQAELRNVEIKLPKTTRTLDDLAESNNADLSVPADRRELMVFLESLQQHAPVVHVSFAAEPSAEFTMKIVSWFRNNVSSYVLVQVGLQPSIAAGCVVRTTNKVFDLSLGRFLRAKRHVLTEALHRAGNNQKTDHRVAMAQNRAAVRPAPMPPRPVARPQFTPRPELTR